MFNAIRVSRFLAVASVAALGAALATGAASPLKAASLGEDKATVNFDRPVEVPGKVLLPGTYVFKSLENNELVQVFSADQKQLFATVTVVPEDRPVQNGDLDCYIQLNKTRGDAPPEVEGFFLPGRATGFQFVYPTAHAAGHQK
jgi:hypothetical protein